MVHFVCVVLAVGSAGAGDFPRGVADFVAFSTPWNCRVRAFRFFTCAAVSAGTDPRLPTGLLLGMCSLSETMLGDKFAWCARCWIYFR